MPDFAYLAPRTLEEAVRGLLLAGARPLAGGTDLLVQLRGDRVHPSVVVDLKHVEGTVGIRSEAGGFVIGASTPCASLGEHAGLRQAWPGVVEAATLIGSTQVQGRATIVGNLCNASPAADSVPALIAARASCLVVGPAGRREIPVETIATAPGVNSLGVGEFVLEVRLPPRPPRSADAYLRLIPRSEMDIAVVGAGVSLTLDAAGIIATAHVALGAVAPTAMLVPDAARVLIGHRLDATVLARLDTAARAACRPITDRRGTAAYRTTVAGVLARRAAATAYQRAGGRT